ncbi:MAG TPA: hypothetical protein VGM82_15235 [Gemmatimonadaceae bacterium]|jgi:hypothetical protein
MEAAEVPIGNIGARGCRRRRWGAWFWSVMTVVIAFMILMSHVSRAMLFVLALPIALAALGFLQAREQTCVFHAALGTRENDDGVVKLDPRARDDVKRRAWRVGVSSVAIAVVLTAAIYFLA